MTEDKASRSLPLTIALHIPTDWTPEQAFAVFTMIDDLREAIWRCYSLQIQDQYRDQCKPVASGVNQDRGNPPF